MHKKFIRTSAVLLIFASSWSTTTEAMEEILDDDDPRSPSSLEILRKEDERIKNWQEINKPNSNKEFVHQYVYSWLGKSTAESYSAWFASHAQDVDRFFRCNYQPHYLKETTEISVTPKIKQNHASSLGEWNVDESEGSYLLTKSTRTHDTCTNCFSTYDSFESRMSAVLLVRDEKHQRLNIRVKENTENEDIWSKNPWRPCTKPQLNGTLKEIWDNANLPKYNHEDWDKLLLKLGNSAIDLDIKNGYETKDRWDFTIRDGCCSIL